MRTTDATINDYLNRGKDLEYVRKIATARGDGKLLEAIKERIYESENKAA
jgi:hypothetical protein